MITVRPSTSEFIKEVNDKTIAITQLAIEYGSAYPKSSESDWIREVVLSMIGIWSRRGRIRCEDAMQYLSYLEDEHRISGERRRQLNWLREAIHTAGK